MKNRLLLICLILLLILPVGLLGLMSSDAGSRWLLQTVFSSLPAQVSAKTIEGRLLERLAISELRYQTATETVAINKLVFAWQPARLFSGTLKIVDISLIGVNINLAETPPAAEASPFDLNADFVLPVDIMLENLLLTDVSFQQGEQRQQLEKLHLSAFTEHGQLNIVSLAVDAQPLAATAKGQMKLGKGFPLSLTTDWQLATAEHGLWQAATTITGDLQQLLFDNQLAAPFKLALKGRIDNLADEPLITARGDWQQLTWPLAGSTPQVSSEQGFFELSGTLDAYQISLNGKLSQPYLPKAQLAFEGKGSMDALSIETLAINSTAGAFQLSGDVSWHDATAFDLTASGQDFNPAILHPELPGSLSFNTRLKGQVGKTLQLAATIDKLSGQLRGHPVSANGKLMLAGEQLTVDAFKIVSGTNKIAVNGTLGQEQAALAVAIDTPAMESLWPGLGGSLKGDGRLQGAWLNPSVKFQASGKRLRFAGHSAGQLAIDIDYHSDAQKTSKIQLSASAIKTGATEISKLLIEGSGTLDQHRFNADIRSSYGDVSSALSGSFKADVWQGNVSKLDLKSKDFGRWQLDDAMTVRIAQSPAGMDVTLAETCLIQQNAALCMQGHYPASGDFTFKAKATALPTSLMQAYLPEQMTVNGILNAEADIEQNKEMLSGNVRVVMPANAKLLLSAQQGSTEFALGASSLSGQLKGTQVAVDFDLGLLAQDYVRGQLQMDTGTTQALSGQINASMLNFALLKPFVPQLSDIKGNLSANLALQGTLDQPVLNGSVALKQGAIELAESSFGLREINLQATAVGGRSNRIQLQGSALPIVLNKKNAPEQLQLKGMINVNADVQQQDGLLTGNYRLDIPANASITLKTKEADTKIAFGASSLSGTVNGDIISADLNLALAAQDYVRAQLQLDTGESQALSGQMTASIVELTLLNPFVPQLSNMKGQFKADLALQGSIDKPLVNGAIRFSNGSVDMNELGLKLSDIKLQALASAQHAERLQLSGSAKSGQGSIKLDGFADLQGIAELTLNGTDFEVAKLPEAQIAVSPDLKVVFADSQGKVTGQLKIPKAIFELKELPENAVKVSPDEVILGEEKAKQAAATAINVDANIDVELGKQVSFSGLGLATSLSGRLKITKTGEKMAMHGRVDMDKARYRSYGQDLTVRKGRFLFNGPVDKPWLDVEAIRVSKSKEVTAILSLTGPLEAPQTRISSEPALPEAEALAYLITGGPLNQVSKSEGNRVASAALSYGAGQVSWIAGKLGVDEFEVQEGKTLQDTLLAAGQYLTPDFYVGTKVGLFNKQAVLVLKHKLTNTINLETEAGTSQRVKLNYEFDTD